MDNREPETTGGKGNGPSLLATWSDKVWRFFSSVRVAIILILVVTGLGLIGALLIQAPSDVLQDPQAYAQWLDTAGQAKVGAWAPLLSLFGFFHVFTSPLFTLAGALLMLNILICNLNRWTGLRLSLRGGNVKQQETFYRGGNFRAELNDIKLAVAAAAAIPQQVLQGYGYRVRQVAEGDSVYLAADKNRYLRLGTYLSHLSLILFVAAFIAGNYFGFRDTGFAVLQGETREVGHDTNLALRLVSFTDEYYDNGMPKDYRSQVDLYDNGQLVKQDAVIRVNQPLSYKGVRFYQSYYGPAVVIKVTNQTGEVIFNNSIALDSQSSTGGLTLNYGYFMTLNPAYFIRVIQPTADTPDAMMKAGELAVDVRDSTNTQVAPLFKLSPGTPRTVNNMEFSYLRESRFSGFQVSRDPTVNIIWLASALFLIGIAMVFYFPYRQVWVLVQSNDRGSRLLVRTVAPRTYNAGAEQNRLTAEFKRKLRQP